MPFALSHKPSKKQLRRPAPSPLDLRKEQLSHQNQHHSLPYPTPPLTGDSMAPQAGFKMFWKKAKSSSSSASSSSSSSLGYGDGSPVRAGFPIEAPRPILKTQAETSGGRSIRFAGGGVGGGQRQEVPEVTVTNYDAMPRHAQTQSMYDGPAAAVAPIVRPAAVSRRSSRPTSPSATSFGARVRVQSAPLSTPPLVSSHVTTPPTAYVSTMQTRAPPPPSPYRPTHERRRSVTRTSTFPEPLPMTNDMAPRPPRHSSLFTASDSTSTLAPLVPMLNIIPATPQDSSEEWGALVREDEADERSSRQLDEAVKLDEAMEEVPLDHSPASTATIIPTIDMALDFSPIYMPSALPSTYSLPAIVADEVPSQPSGEDVDMRQALTSPPFESFSSLPSLDSQHSMPSSGSENSIPSSDSMSSLASFPDVEEALGSMLASLSESSLPSHVMSPTLKEYASVDTNPGLGLGLGLDLPPRSSISTPTPTAPLSPRRRLPPAPLDLSHMHHAHSLSSDSSTSSLGSAPSCINHRVAFYGSAKAAPNSPTSGVFVQMPDQETHFMGGGGGGGGMAGFRDSISLASEASDDDLHTASIISLAPVSRKGDVSAGKVVVEMMLPADEEMEPEVGLAF